MDRILEASEGAEPQELGGIVMTALRILEEETALAGSDLVNQVAEIEKTPEAFALVLDGHDRLLTLGSALVRRVMRETGALETEGNGQAQLSTEIHWANSKRKLQRSVQRHKVAFYEASTELFHRNGVSSAKNAGGKPLAKHWDAMWADIATRLWSGDLQPRSQADIKTAMFAWFNKQEIEVGDTAITERARALWVRMQADN